MSLDLFGSEIVIRNTLRDKYFVPPMSVINTRESKWQNRKRYWKSIGIKSELGRDARKDLSGTGQLSDKIYGKNFNYDTVGMNQTNSIFDPVLTELMYNWFCVKNGTILDPFAGGSVRGIVASKLNLKYTGIELRPEQVKDNISQCDIILDGNIPIYHTGDSDLILESITEMFDMIFSCPPYADLEIYSDLPEDISNMSYDNFILKYGSIINKCINKLKPNCYAIFVLGDARDKNGNYYGLIADTIKIFQKNGCQLYNEIILLNPIGTKCLTVEQGFKNKKLGKVHQNVLVFKKSKHEKD